MHLTNFGGPLYSFLFKSIIFLANSFSSIRFLNIATLIVIIYGDFTACEDLSYPDWIAWSMAESAKSRGNCKHTVHLTARLPKIPHTGGGETSNTREFSHCHGHQAVLTELYTKSVLKT